MLRLPVINENWLAPPFSDNDLALRHVFDLEFDLGYSQNVA